MSFIFYFDEQVQACDKKARTEGIKTRQLQVAAEHHTIDIYIDDYLVRLEGDDAKEFAESMTGALRRANLIT